MLSRSTPCYFGGASLEEQLHSPSEAKTDLEKDKSAPRGTIPWLNVEFSDHYGYKNNDFYNWKPVFGDNILEISIGRGFGAL